MIAFQTVDPEGDIWSNTALLFKSEGDAISFFNNKQLVFDTLECELEAGETIDDVKLYMSYNHDNELGDQMPFAATLECEYGGKIRMAHMAGGVVVTIK